MEAIFGLVGVLLGGTITWSIQRWETGVRVRAELRTAARLVGHEHVRAAGALHSVLEESTEREEDEVYALIRPWIESGYIATDEWREHRTALASGLTLEEWTAAAEGARAIEYVRTAATPGYDRAAITATRSKKSLEKSFAALKAYWH